MRLARVTPIGRGRRVPRSSGLTTIVPEHGGAGAHLREHRHRRRDYRTRQVRVQVGDAPYVGPALAFGTATMLTVTTTFR